VIEDGGVFRQFPMGLAPGVKHKKSGRASSPAIQLDKWCVGRTLRKNFSEQFLMGRWPTRKA